MDTFILWYLALQVLVLLAFLIISRIKDKRLKSNQGRNVPPGYVKTEEQVIDPTTSKKQTVYYNPDTGQRFYREE
ncbi:MAG: hypothetical protein ACM32O_01720 [Clostridia bacterium]